MTDGGGRGAGSAPRRGQSTLEWVIGAAIILSTLATAVIAWNQGLAHKIGDLVGQLATK